MVIKQEDVHSRARRCWSWTLFEIDQEEIMLMVDHEDEDVGHGLYLKSIKRRSGYVDGQFIRDAKKISGYVDG